MLKFTFRIAIERTIKRGDRVPRGVCSGGRWLKLGPAMGRLPLDGRAFYRLQPSPGQFPFGDLLPVADRAHPEDYARSGFDRGHQAPAADFAWSPQEMIDSFSMANMAPQLPGLNRAEWEHLEETVRAWVLARGELVIYTGPVLPAKPETIGIDHIAVPSAFWKVIINPGQCAALAFVMPQEDIKKGDLRPWQVSIEAVQQEARITLPLPAGINLNSIPKLWPASIAGGCEGHKRACS